MFRRELVLLLPLYLAQGLPFGFQVTALPLYLRERGVSLTAIGFAGVLSAPWILKALWSPLVDRYGSSGIGHYKSWILPMQLLMALTALVAAVLADTTLFGLLSCMLLLNLFAATQDIAVDGLAVRTLHVHELGPANAIQVVGYKAGMLIGGGLLVAASDTVGWRGVFIGMAAIMACVWSGAALCIREGSTTPSTAQGPRESFHDIARTLWTVAKSQGAGWLLLIGTYKIGETMIDVMWNPFLHDGGFSAGQIGLWLGTYGMVASLTGSLLGAYLSRRIGLEGALILCAIVRTPSLFGEWWLTQIPPTENAVILLSITEHLFGGMCPICSEVDHAFALELTTANRMRSTLRSVSDAGAEFFETGPTT